MVEQRKFAITDATSNRDIDLSKQWSQCFRSGQKVNMAIFFRHLFDSCYSCPGCGAQQAGDAEGEKTWSVVIDCFARSRINWLLVRDVGWSTVELKF